LKAVTEMLVYVEASGMRRFLTFICI